MYKSVSDAIEMCKQYGEPWLAKCNLKDAYLMCPIRIRDRHLLGFSWGVEGIQRIYRFTSIPFGLCSSARTFDNLACVLKFMAKKNGAIDTSILIF